MTRLIRLTNILLQLQSKRLITSQELADKFGISQRTIYRDIRALEEAGVPVVGEIGSGYYLPEDYRIPPVMVTEQEVNALLTAQKYFKGNSDSSTSESLDSLASKIKALLKYGTKEKAEKMEHRVMFYQTSADTKTKHLGAIQSAIADNRLINIKYHAIHSDQVSERSLEPLAVYYTKDKWLMIAYCRMREAVREFRIDRVLELHPTNIFFPPREFSFEEYIAQVIKNS